jgi:LPS O-antigen subunit length determinant protein (WzzB/FepE family)
MEDTTMKKITILLVCLALFLSACESKVSQVTDQEDTAMITIKDFEQEVPSGYKFDGSMDILKEFFNSISANLALQVYIKDFRVDKDNFEAVLDDKLYKGTKLCGKLDENNMIKTVTLVCDKAEEEDEILRYNLLMQNMITVTTPEMDINEVDDFVISLGIPKNDITLKDGSKNIEKDGHIYNLRVEGQKLTFDIHI